MVTEEGTIIVRFAGDSGDGIQLVGEQLTITAALSGRDVRTFPDFPAEIRAPAGTLGGVSGFQLAMSEGVIFTAGESIDVLVAFNPAALKKSLSYLKEGGLLILNSDHFKEKDFIKAKWHVGIMPELLERFQVLSLSITTLTEGTLLKESLTLSEARKAKNFFVLGLLLWLFDLPKTSSLAFIQSKFKNNEKILKGNQAALSAGYNHAVTLELSRTHFMLGKSERLPGDYRQLTGVEAVALALSAIATATQSNLLVAGYPITPASGILHECANLADYGVALFQAEDEVAAICAAIGASFGGKLSFCCTSGPGFDLKSESLGLAVMAELPLVVADVQRAGASTGLPTKTSQSDLLMACFGRHGEAPLPVLAATSPKDCFDTVIEAFYLAVKFMTPVVVLLDAWLANAAEPWCIPDMNELRFPNLHFNRFTKHYMRDELLSRSWNIPGTKALMHQIGGLEKHWETGEVSYESANHAKMTAVRREKILGVAKHYPKLNVQGASNAKILVIGWGSTKSSLEAAVRYCAQEGLSLALLCLRHLYPLPKELQTLLTQYEKIIVAELNSGHLCQMIRAEYLVDARAITACDGQPFSVSSLVQRLYEECEYDHLQT